MSLLYADPSAIVRAYFADEPDHPELRAMLLEGPEPVVVSEIGRVELASAVMSAARSGRLPAWRRLLDRIDADCGIHGPISLLALRSDVIMPVTHRLVIDHRLRTLDAMHLAVAIEECPALASDNVVVFVTRDELQAEAARELGLAVR